VSTAAAEIVEWLREHRGLCYYAASFVCVCLMGVLLWAPLEIYYRGWIVLALLVATVSLRLMARRAN